MDTINIEQYTKELRSRFFAAIRKNPCSCAEIALATGIGTGALKRFVDGSSPSRLKTLMRLEKWVKSQEG